MPVTRSIAIPPDVLVEHAQFVRSVAFAIVRDDADADDVAQDALARGLATGPGNPSARRSWLGAVARNFARMLIRGRSRSESIERRASRADVAASAVDLAARAEAVRAVADAVLALDEPMRTVVLLRHYEGMPPRAIAARIGEPVEAVKKRLQRAHERLRASLAAHSPQGRGRRLSALAALAGVRLDAPTAPTLASATAAVGGGVAMTATAKIGIGAVAAAAVALVGWIATRPASDDAAGRSSEDAAPALLDAPSSAGHAPTELAAKGSGPTPVAVRESTTGTPSPDAGSADPRAADAEVTLVEVMEQWKHMSPPGSLEVIALGLVRLDGFTATLVSTHHPQPVEYTATPGADGVFRFRDVRRGMYDVIVHGPGVPDRRWDIAQGVPQVPEGSYRQVVVYGGASLSGRAFDRGGKPLSGHRVTLAWPEPIGSGNRFVTTTDEEGRYEFLALRSGVYQVGVSIGDPTKGPTDDRWVGRTLRPDEHATVDVGSTEPSHRVGGTVTLASGTRAGPPLRLWIYASTSTGAMAIPEAVARVGEDGRYEAMLQRGDFRGMLPRPGTNDHFQWTLSVGDADVTADVALPGVRVAGTLEDKTTRERPRGGWALVRLIPVDPRAASQWDAYVDADRVFRFDGVPPGRYQLSGRAQDEKVVFDEPLDIAVPADRDVVGLTILAGRK